MRQLTGTWNISTVSSSRRTLHAIVLPFLCCTDDNTGADAELMMPATQWDQYSITTAMRSLTLHLNSNGNPQHIPVKHKQQQSQLLQRKKCKMPRVKTHPRQH